MRSPSLSPLALAGLAAFAVACGPKPPPPAAPEPPPPVIVAPPVVKEPPKCEALSEGCQAAADTRARIARTDVVMTPPPGWTFAQEAEAMTAQASGDGSAMALTTFDEDPKDPKREAASRERAFVDLLMHLRLEVGAKVRPTWKKPDDKRSSKGNLNLDMFELEAAGKRGGQKGPLLVTVVHLTGGRALLGIGFVPTSDPSGAEQAIMTALETLARAPAGAAQ